jgi:hypothetical protein
VGSERRRKSSNEHHANGCTMLGDVDRRAERRPSVVRAWSKTRNRAMNPPCTPEGITEVQPASPSYPATTGEIVGALLSPALSIDRGSNSPYAIARVLRESSAQCFCLHASDNVHSSLLEIGRVDHAAF